MELSKGEGDSTHFIIKRSTLRTDKLLYNEAETIFTKAKARV